MIVYSVSMVFHTQVKRNLMNIFTLKRKQRKEIIELLVDNRNYLIHMKFLQEVLSSTLMVLKSIINFAT